MNKIQEAKELLKNNMVIGFNEAAVLVLAAIEDLKKENKELKSDLREFASCFKQNN